MAVRQLHQVFAAAVALTLLAGCTSTPKPAGKTGSSSVVTSAPTSASTPSSGSSSSPAEQALPGDCSTILPLGAVEIALNRRVIGRTAFVVNVPDASIGMLARVNCRYGIGPPVIKRKKKVYPPPNVEVSISLYSTAAQAATRVQATVTAWRDNGAAQRTVPLNGNTATLLTGYGSPLLVVAHGPRTVAVTVVAALLRGRSVTSALSQVAARALSGSGG